MESNEMIREQIFGIIEDQIKDNNPPETNMTFKRLIEEGYDDYDAKIMIAQCIAVELYDAIKHGKKFNEKRYLKNLMQLPKKPFG